MRPKDLFIIIVTLGLYGLCLTVAVACVIN